MKIVAIDFGFKRMGIAFSDETQRFALPFATLPVGERRAEAVAAFLLPRKKEIAKIVVGLPLLLNGQKGDMAKHVEIFAAALEAELEIPVILFDERLSSQQAEKGLREIPLSRKKRSEKIDMVAASLLLQTYLDQRR